MLLLLAAGLCLHAGALAGGMQLMLTAEESEVLSEGAMRALSQWLMEAKWSLQAQEDVQQAALYHEEELLAAVTGSEENTVLTSGGLSAPTETARFSVKESFSLATQRVQALSALLADWEKSANASAELGGAVKAKTQLSYVLSKEQWAQVWPAVCEVLGEQLRGVTIESKGTLKRYFAADGSEIGAYFYAEKVRIAQDDVREVRLEYAFRPEEGLYLAFRCPNARETRNLRISVTGRRIERTDRISYTLDGDIRHKHADGQDIWLADVSFKEADGMLTGQAKIDYTKKRGEDAVKHTLTVKPALAADTGEGTAAYAYERSGLAVLSGMLTLAREEARALTLPKVNAAEALVTEELALGLMRSLDDIAREDQLELLYYLNRGVFLTGDAKDVYLMYDPEFTVTEVPE